MEKTFEELIEEVSDKNNYPTRLWRQQLTPNADVIKLMQQVREATIAECLEIAWNEEDSAFIHEQIASLEANRIRIEP